MLICVLILRILSFISDHILISFLYLIFLKIVVHLRLLISIWIRLIKVFSYVIRYILLNWRIRFIRIHIYLILLFYIIKKAIILIILIIRLKNINIITFLFNNKINNYFTSILSIISKLNFLFFI